MWRTKIATILKDRVGNNPVNKNDDMTTSNYVSSGHLQAVNPPLLTNGIPNIFVYTSIVDPVYFGAQQAVLLRIIPYEPPTENNLGATVTTQFNKLYYLPINTSRLEEIEFLLAMDNGDPVNFIEGGKTVLLLHVRPKL